MINVVIIINITNYYNKYITLYVINILLTLQTTDFFRLTAPECLTSIFNLQVFAIWHL